MTYIVKSGSLQYIVNTGDLVPVQKLEAEAGSTIELIVLASFENGKVDLKPSVIKAMVVDQFRDDKIRVVKYKAKSKYHKQYGHRQDMTLVEIL
jgi:large subunit ribosomal protein L21